PGDEKPRTSVAAAAATRVRMGARAGRLLALDTFLRLEGGATAAGRLHIRVVDREARAHERVDEVDLRAGQVGSAERIDDDAHPVHLDLVVTVLRASVETERVLEPRTATALNGDPENGDLALRLGSHELADLLGGAVGDCDHLELSVPTGFGWKRGQALWQL